MHNKKILNIALIAGLLFSTPSIAAVANIVGNTEGVEAENIVLTWYTTSKTGYVDIRECEKCPLKLKVDETTQYFLNGKAITPIEARSLSRKMGTVVYKNGHVIRILW